MSDQDVLKEFLIKIGYDVNEASERKAGGSIDKITKGALALGAAVTAAAVAVGVGVQRIATSFDAMYFASGRIGASAGDIKAFQYAISQLGGTSEGAMQSLESLARKMRENPGTSKQIESLTGTQIKNGRLNEQNLKDMGAFFKRLIDTGRGYQAILFAEAWGFDEKTMRAMASGIDKFADQYRRKMRAAGLDPDKAAADAQRFMQAWRDIFTTLEVIIDSALTKIMGDGKGGLQGFAAWFEKQTPLISDALAKLATSFGAALKGWEEGLGKIKWDESAKSVGAFAASVTTLVNALAKLVGLAAEHPTIAGMIAGGLAGSRLGPYGAAAGALAGGAIGDQYGGGPEERARRRAAMDAVPGGDSSGGWSWRKTTLGAWISSKLGGGGAKLSDLSRRGTVVAPPGAPGQYRPIYKLSDADLSDAVVNTIAGEARMNHESIDAVVNNLFNRLGTKAYGPSGNLEEVARAPGQYAGYRRATPEQAALIRSRIRAVASGAIPDSTGGANEYRAGWYMGPWGRKHRDSPVIGGNRFAYNPAVAPGLYAPYKEPKTIAVSPPVTASAGSLPRRSPEEIARVQAESEAAARKSAAIGRSPFGALRMDAFKVAPIGTGPRYMPSGGVTNHNSSTVSVKVDGAQEPDAVARYVVRRVEDANNRALRNGQGAVN